MFYFFFSRVGVGVGVETLHRLREEERRMSRSRLLWFTFGFASTYVALYQTVLKDLTLQRHAFTSHTERYFRILEARLSNIEQSSSSSSVPAPNQNLDIKYLKEARTKFYARGRCILC
ncbi:hypothetical protein GYH30_043957 [Glycine max]|nr:hypothetical protein GYH30_043957 [Glycine max]